MTDDQQRARELLAQEYAMAGSAKRADKIIAGFDTAPSTEHAIAAITAALRAAPEWQPMESAPRDGTVVLVAIGGSDIPQPCRFRERVGWVIAWDDWRIPAHDGPRGWMPLPVAARPQGVN